MALDDLVFKHRNLKINLPKSFKKLFKEIKDSKYILDLKDNYDCEGSKAPSLKIWKSAIEFITDYTKFIYTKAQIIIQTPKIYDGNHDSIDILFRNKTKTRMLINISEENREIIASYYGDNHGKIKLITEKEKKTEIKERIKYNPDKIHKPLVNWMKTYLKT